MEAPLSYKALNLEHERNKGLISDADRDKFFDYLKQQQPANKLCFECGSRNPTWISCSFGIYLCLTCAGNHRNMGSQVSFIRSITLDTIKIGEALKMELGGNQTAKLYFASHGIGDDNIYDYRCKSAERYRSKLEKECNDLMETFLPHLLTSKPNVIAENTVDGSADLNVLSIHENDLVPKTVFSSIPAKSKKTKTVQQDDFDFDFDRAFDSAARRGESHKKKITITQPIAPRRCEESPSDIDDGDPLSKFKNATAISSDALFGNHQCANDGWIDDEMGTRLAILRESAIDKASEAAMIAQGAFKQAAKWISSLSDQSFPRTTFQ